MKQSLMFVVFAAALFLDRYALSEAMPASNGEDGSFERDALGPLLGDGAGAEGAVGAGDALAEGRYGGGRKVIVVADPGLLWRNLRLLDRGLPYYKQRAGESGLSLDRREVGGEQSAAFVKRDTMRCMVGRVYRPCWEV